MTPEKFEEVGIQVVKQLANYLRNVDSYPISAKSTNKELKAYLERFELEEKGVAVEECFTDIIKLLSENSFNGNHKGQWAYILPTADPICAISDLVSSTINQNLGGWELSPAATEMENQCIQWVSRIIGYENGCAGTFTSGGNVANFTGLLCARKRIETQAPNFQSKLRIYSTETTHTWIDKYVELFGFSSENVQHVQLTDQFIMDDQELEKLLEQDIESGLIPMAIVATAGSTSTGAIDPIRDISLLAKKYNVWLHIDGAYGAPANLCLNDPHLASICEADSVAVDPHKWLYSTYEAGCILVKDSELMRDTFTHVPVYYGDEEAVEEGEINYYQFGLQNSRSFKSLKTWMSLRVLGIDGLRDRINTDLEHSDYCFKLVKQFGDLAAYTHSLGIVTFRYFDDGLDHAQLNTINRQIEHKINAAGSFYISHTEINGVFLLRLCFLNLKTQKVDIDDFVQSVQKLGRSLVTNELALERNCIEKAY